MFVNSALVVDEIRENEYGGVDLIGLREELYFDALPVVLERLTLFIELAVSPEDRGVRHEIDVRILDPESAILRELPLRFTLPPDYARPTAPLDPTLFEIPFTRFGLHSVELRMRETTVRRLPLFILPRDDVISDRGVHSDGTPAL